MMTQLTLAQAIQTAIDAEKAAAQFYARLARNTEDPAARELLEKMADDELNHERQLSDLARRLCETELPEVGIPLAEGIEIRADCSEAADLDYHQALQLALEGERNAQMLYDALSEGTTLEVKVFFQGMSTVEKLHARWVTDLIAKAKAGR